MIVFFDHPIGERIGTDVYKHADNMQSAIQWIHFLSRVTKWAIDISWFAYVVAAIPDQRRLIDSLRILERCDAYAMCGGIVSPHMHYNWRAARRAGIPVLDLTTCGVLPPDPSDEAGILIDAQVMRTLARTPRRVWLPLLTHDELKHLERARYELEVRMPNINEDVLAVLDRILVAAQQGAQQSSRDVPT